MRDHQNRLCGEMLLIIIADGLGSCSSCIPARLGYSVSVEDFGGADDKPIVCYTTPLCIN
jgi:hypothetical protein